MPGHPVGLYVARVDVATAGPTAFVAVTRDGRAGSDAIEVATPQNSKLPASGRAAVPVPSATTADPRGVAHVCTADPPCGMHEVSLDTALAQRRPVLLMFATPRYCQTAVCGPSVSVLDGVRTSQDWGPVAFIHVEIYRDDGQTLSEPVERWGLPSEPWLFAIGADGIIRARADGPLLTLPDEVGRLGRAAIGQPLRPRATCTTGYRSSMRALVRLAVLAAATLALVGCSTAATPMQAPEPGIVHVHALALDPADPSALYIATHTGLFHVDGTNNAQRVGGHYHDLMGFTAAGPGDFIASGHPDLRTRQLLAPGKPPLLGLVHSRDGGAEWRPLSLLGDADFHSLQAAHGLVYGYDSTGGRFMVSHDRTTWETRSSLSLMDFAVSPADPNVVVASTWQQGVLASTDGGRSWQPTTSGAFVVLDWADSALYGLTPNGTLGVSRDGGMTWQQQGSIGGSPEALLATDDMLVAAAADRGIVQSRDGGRTWTVRLSTAAHRPSS